MPGTMLLNLAKSTYVVLFLAFFQHGCMSQEAPIPDSLTMYVGGNDGGDPAEPEGTEVGGTLEVDEGVDLIFTCWIMDANPPASITWTLDGSDAGLNWVDIDSDPVDGLSDTINSLVPTYHEVVQGNCGEVLQCASAHPETGDAQTDETTLLVVVSPDDVDLELLASSDPAALPSAPDTDIGTQNVGVGEAQTELVLVCGHDYNFESTTTNGVTPEADFTWERRSDPATAGTEVDGGADPAADPDTVSCSPAPTTSNLVGFTANHNNDNDQYLCAIANNKHADDPVDECVLLDVNVEVQAANMEMTVKRSSDDSEVDFAGGDYLIDGEEYYVDCTVKEATPPPDFTISLGGVDLGAVTTPSPGYTDQAEGAGVDRENILTTARVTFTADYATECTAEFAEGLVCEAVNSANTLINSDPQTVSEPAARVELEPSRTTGSVELAIDSTTTTNADQDGDDADTTAILTDGLVYDFECAVISDPEVEIVWTLNGDEVQTDPSTSESIDCDSGPYMRTYQLTASHEDHQCETLSCTAGGVTDMITFQILKPPTMDAAGGGEGIKLRYRESDDGAGGPGAWMDLEHDDNRNLTADKDYEFECKVLNINPVSPTDGSGFVAGACPTGDFPIALDVVDIDFCINTDLGTAEVCNDGDANDMEPATANGDLFDLTDTHTHTVGATDDCGTTIICRAAFDPDGGHADDADSPFIRVTIARTVLPAQDTITLTLNPTPNADQDGDDEDETAILIEDLEYNFDCKVESDPDVDVRWYVKNAAGDKLYTQDDINTPDAVNCAMYEYTLTYELRADRVTYADLQCGYIECIADPDGPNPITKTITFQIWKPPTLLDGGGGGGPGIQLRYRMVGDTTWNTITHDDTEDLEIDTAYEFECKVLNVNPVSPAGTSGFVEGACSAGYSAVSRDIVDIDFCIDTDLATPDAEVIDMGVQLDSEPATANGDLFDLTDTYSHLVLDAYDCGTTVTCKVAYDPTGAHGDVTDDSPFITVKITHVSETTAVTLIPPEFGDDVAGEVDGDTLTLYDGDTYTLSCVPEGADPDTDIQWYLVDDCAKPPEMDATNGAQLIRSVFIPHETVADCDLQNDPFPFPGPADHARDYDIWDTFLADFETQKDKCLRCLALDTFSYDDFTLDIRKTPSAIIGFDGPTDDDNDGLKGQDDVLNERVTLCNGDSFDLMIIAYAAFPAVETFTITLDGVTVDNDVSQVTVQPSSIEQGLFDSMVVVSFQAGSLSLRDNDTILEACDPDSMVCFEITINVVDLPDGITFYISNPFSESNDEANIRVFSTQDQITLVQGEAYRIVCATDNASPPSNIDIDIPYGVSVSESIHTPDPDSQAVTPATLYDTQRMMTIEVTTERLDGMKLCCEATNAATILKNLPQSDCKTLNVIEQTVFIGDGDVFYDTANTIPVLDQEGITLICLLRAAPGYVDIQWYLDGEKIDSQLHSETYQLNADSINLIDVQSTYTFTPRLNVDDGDSITCGSLVIGQSTVNYLQVIVPPEVPIISISPEFDSQDNVLLFGNRYTISCVATSAKPAADITVQLNDVPIESTSAYDTTNTQNGRLRDSYTETRIVASWSTHEGAQLTCSASNVATELSGGSPDDYSTSVTLTVLSPPLDVELAFEQANNGAADDAFDQGLTLVTPGQAVFHCRGLKAKPASNLEWKLNNEIVSGSSFNTTSNPDGYTSDSESSYVLETSFDSIGSTITCCASNEIEAGGSELCETTTLDVITEPNNIIISDGTRTYNPGDVVEVRSGNTLTCTAVGARPAGSIGWDAGGVFIGGKSGDVTTNEDNELLSDFSNNLDYSWTSEYDGAVLTCIALNTANTVGVTSSVTISVKVNPTPIPAVTTKPMTTTSQSSTETTIAEDTLTTTLKTTRPTVGQIVTTKTIEPKDGCSSDPCVNQGICVNQALTSSAYICLCTAAYTGTNCETRIVVIDPCSSSPCLNQGSCYPLSETGYRCVCTSGFIGVDCNNRVNVNVPAPIIIQAPVSVTVDLFAPVTLTCRIANVNTILWTKDGIHLAEFIGEEVITIQSVGARDQGRYRCYGEGTADGTVVESDATILVQGILLFFVTGARFPSFIFNGDLTNPDSLSFVETADRIESFLAQQFTTIGLLSTSPFFQVTSLSDGSVIADLNIYVMKSDETVIDLMNTLERGFSLIADENNGYFDASDVDVKSAGICESLRCDASPHGFLYIPATHVGQYTDPGSVTSTCPWYTIHADRPMLSGFCDGDFLSQPYFLPDSLSCTCGRNLTVDEQLEYLAELELSMDNVQIVLDDATSITEKSQSISVDGVQSAVNIVVNAVEVQSPEPMVTSGVIGVVNNVMDVSPDTLQETAYKQSLNDATLALETQLQNVQVSDDTPYRNVRANLAAEVHDVASNDLRDGLGIVSTGAAAEAFVDENIMLLGSSQLADEVKPEADTMIFIPATVFDAAKDSESEMVRVTFAFFSTSALFKSVSLAETNSNNQAFQRDINTRVLSCTVGGKRITNLKEPIRTVFQRISSDYFNTTNNSACVYWDYESDNRRGNWSTEGCRTIGDIQNGRQECECDHLTNFAVLMDIYGQSTLTQVQALILKIISLLGCSMSFAGVAATFVTYLAYKKLRKKQHSRILINMCFALMLLYIAFIVMVSMDTTRNPMAPEVNVIGCSVLAGVLQFAVLSSLGWMGVEGANMYLQFVKVFDNHVVHFMLKAFVIAWGVPLVITLLTGFVADPYARRDYCFLEKDPLIYGVLVPIGIILAVNFVIFGLVLHRISNLKASRAGKAGSKLKALKERLRRAFTILILMGLTWSIGYLSLIYIANGIVQILFCIFNALQGVAIFVLYCIRQPEVLRFWHSFDVHTLVTGRSVTVTKTRSREQSSGARQSSQPKRRPVLNGFDPDSVPWTSAESRRFGNFPHTQY